MNKLFFYCLRLVCITCVLQFSSVLSAQENAIKSLVSSFENYTSPYREMAYCHLNKSTYIKGEPLGFKAYVLDKHTKTPSVLTKNLYCVILDSLDNIVKQKLIKIDRGIAHNTFSLDSVFKTGKYTFKAYTNWMKNFDEPSAFIERFHVIDPEQTKTVKRQKVANELDAQFLPEGGHFVHNVKTNVGVTIKNAQGYGVPNIFASVFDFDNKFITNFQTNSLGVGRFLLYPDSDKTYTVKFNYLNTPFEYTIRDIEARGITIHVNKSREKLAIELKTNPETLENIQGKPYKLTVHNGKSIKVININFDNIELIQLIDFKDLFSGINTITLFNEVNQPILERLFFNYEGINMVNLKNPQFIPKRDSLNITIPIIHSHDKDDIFHISVSILPEGTKSYNKHQNIISYTYLQPYLKGYVEHAAYYFTDITRQKEYELDNLLITQGWSSYNWNNIFNYDGNNNYVFEDGIVIKGNSPDKEDKSFIIYPLKNTDGYMKDLPANEPSFLKAGFYPQEKETLNLSILNNKGKAKKANLYVQFSPTKIPEFNTNMFEPIPPKKGTITELKTSKPFDELDLSKAQSLEEVIVKATSRETRIARIKGSSYMKIDVFDDTKRMLNLSLPTYINTYMPGFFANEQRGVLTITNRNVQSFNNNNVAPLVFLDDVQLNSLEFLVNFDMSRVDYIAYDRHGFGEGLRGSGGVIKIYTSNVFPGKKQNQYFRKFDFPLAFSEPKTYYVPKYEYYNTDFYKEYGVVDWIPNAQIDNTGNLNFTVFNPAGTNMKIYIEGISNKGIVLLNNTLLNVKESN